MENGKQTNKILNKSNPRIYNFITNEIKSQNK